MLLNISENDARSLFLIIFLYFYNNGFRCYKYEIKLVELKHTKLADNQEVEAESEKFSSFVNTMARLT